jgi:hypothetical protein
MQSCMHIHTYKIHIIDSSYILLYFTKHTLINTESDLHMHTTDFPRYLRLAGGSSTSMHISTKSKKPLALFVTSFGDVDGNRSRHEVRVRTSRAYRVGPRDPLGLNPGRSCCLPPFVGPHHTIEAGSITAGRRPPIPGVVGAKKPPALARARADPATITGELPRSGDHHHQSSYP